MRQNMESAPRDGSKIFLYFKGWAYAPIASWECFEGGKEDGSDATYAWCFEDDSFGEHGDGWVYSDSQQPDLWFPMPDNI